MKRIYPDRPIVGVGVVVWHRDRVLLVQRGKPPSPGRWSLPGGAQEVGETIAEAARRELSEETGVKAVLGEVVATVDLIRRDDAGQVRYHYTLIDFVAEASSEALRPGDDAADARWFTLDEVRALDLWSETLRVIELSQERRPCR